MRMGFSMADAERVVVGIVVNARMTLSSPTICTFSPWYPPTAANAHLGLPIHQHAEPYTGDSAGPTAIYSACHYYCVTVPVAATPPGANRCCHDLTTASQRVGSRSITCRRTVPTKTSGQG